MCNLKTNQYQNIQKAKLKEKKFFWSLVLF